MKDQVRKEARSYLVVLSQPIVWCFVCLTFVEELMGLRLFDVMSVSENSTLLATITSSYFGYSLMRLFALMALLLLLTKTRTFARYRFTLPIIAFLIAAGAPLAILGGVTSSVFLAGSGLLLLTGAMMLLWLMAYELVAELSFAWLRRILIANAVIGALCVPLYSLPSEATSPTIIFLLVLSAFLARGSRNSPEVFSVSVKSAVTRTVIVPRPSIIAGFFVVAVAFAFSTVGLFSGGTVMATQVMMGTKLLAAFLFSILVYSLGDSSYAVILRAIAMLAVMAFVLYLAPVEPLIARALMATSFSLFEIVCLFAVLNLASYSKSGSLIIIFAYDFLVYGAVTCGGALAEVSPLSPELGTGITVVLTLALVAASVWSFGDAAVESFFWLPDGKESADRKPPSPADPDPCAILAKERGLSTRELEVLSLFSSGRTAAFIAEQLFISPSTVRSHVRHIYEKCDVHSRQELITMLANRISAEAQHDIAD